MNRKLRIYRIIDMVMTYARNEAEVDLPYEPVKTAVTEYCDTHPKSAFRTHAEDDAAARQITASLTGAKIW